MVFMLKNPSEWICKIGTLVYCDDAHGCMECFDDKKTYTKRYSFDGGGCSFDGVESFERKSAHS